MVRRGAERDFGITTLSWDKAKNDNSVWDASSSSVLKKFAVGILVVLYSCGVMSKPRDFWSFEVTEKWSDAEKNILIVQRSRTTLGLQLSYSHVIGSSRIEWLWTPNEKPGSHGFGVLVTLNWQKDLRLLGKQQCWPEARSGAQLCNIHSTFQLRILSYIFTKQSSHWVYFIWHNGSCCYIGVGW
jgi:hypothetical protein